MKNPGFCSYIEFSNYNNDIYILQIPVILKVVYGLFFRLVSINGLLFQRTQNWERRVIEEVTLYEKDKNVVINRIFGLWNFKYPNSRLKLFSTIYSKSLAVFQVWCHLMLSASELILLESVIFCYPMSAGTAAQVSFRGLAVLNIRKNYCWTIISSSLTGFQHIRRIILFLNWKPHSVSLTHIFGEWVDGR